jgi:hypothetical protein
MVGFDEPFTIDAQQHRDVTSSHLSIVVMNVDLTSEFAALGHHIEVAAWAVEKRGVERCFAGKSEWLTGAIQAMFDAAIARFQEHTGAPQQNDAAIDAGERREWRVALDFCNADSPVEIAG